MSILNWQLLLPGAITIGSWTSPAPEHDMPRQPESQDQFASWCESQDRFAAESQDQFQPESQDRFAPESQDQFQETQWRESQAREEMSGIMSQGQNHRQLWFWFFFSVFENVLFLCRNSHFRKLKNKSSESKVAGGFFLNVAALRREDGVLRVDGGFKLVFRGALAGDSNGMIYYLCENKKQTYSMCTKHSAHLFFLEPKGGR